LGKDQAMTDRTMDARTEAALRDLALAIDWPDPVDFTPRLSLDQSGPTSRRHGVVWLAGAAAVVLAIFLIPTARQAVANLLEVAGIRFEFGDGPDLPVPTNLTPGVQVDMEEASRAVDFPIIVPSALPPPDAVHLLQWELGSQVFLSWAASERLPEVGASGIGVLLAEFRANLNEQFFEKLLVAGTTVDRVEVAGVPAFWLAGAPHVFMFDAGGPLVEDSTRLTGNVLVWEADGITYRLESNLSLDESLVIAESLGT
jgi:hypothetical protein